MIDVTIAYEKYKFLGREFLTWLFYEAEEKNNFDKDQLFVGSKVIFEREVDNSIEKITINGDEAQLEEGKLALSKGAQITEIEFNLRSEENEFKFCIQGESFNFKSIKPPSTESLKKKEEFEGAVLEKHYLNSKVIDFIKNQYRRFLKLRLSDNWGLTAVKIRNWIKA